MKTILVPVDFSEQSRNAAYHAAEIAKSLNARLLLFHAYMMPTPVSEVPYVMVTVDELQKDNENLIKKEAAHLNEKYGMEIEWLVRIGVPSDEIKQVTEERDIHLVVMGMKGVGGIDKIIGSTTINAIRKLHVPLLVVPQNARFVPLQNILYATDLNYEINTRLLQPLVELVKKHNAHLHILNIKTPGTNTVTDEKEWENQMREVFNGLPFEFHSEENSSVESGINSYIENHNCQLLVMIARKHSFFERLFNKSHTRIMAYETHIPLLILTA